MDRFISGPILQSLEEVSREAFLRAERPKQYGKQNERKKYFLFKYTQHKIYIFIR
jgi:hypothetical protein